MRKFEFRSGASLKFWEIEVTGNSYTVRYGRIGSDGQTRTKAFGSAEEAQRQANKVINSKVKKGYVEAFSATATIEGGVTNPGAGLWASPPDIEAWQVHADVLLGQGDVRGELVAMQIARASDRSNGSLRSREKALLKLHSDVLFDPLMQKALGACLEVDWGFGYFKRAKVQASYNQEDVNIIDLLDSLLPHASSRYLQRLEIGLAGLEGENDYTGVRTCLERHGQRQGLKALHIGAFDYPEDTEISWTEIGSIEKLWALYPDLVDLQLTGGGIELGAATSSTLRRLKLETGGLPRAAAQSLATADLPVLEDLEVWFGTQRYNGECSVAEVEAILGHPWPALTVLGLMNADFADDLCEVVVASPLVRQLRRLNLSMGTMTDQGAERLIRGASCFAHLEALNVNENFITAGVAARLKAAIPNVIIGNQEDPDDWIYVSVGE